MGRKIPNRADSRRTKGKIEGRKEGRNTLNDPVCFSGVETAIFEMAALQ